MKARLTKQQVQMLLDGKDLTFGRNKLAIPKEGDVPDELRKWLDFVNRGEIDVIVDTKEMTVDFERKKGVQDD